MPDGNLDDAYTRLLRLMLELEQPELPVNRVIPWTREEAEVFTRSVADPDEIDLLVCSHLDYEAAVELMCVVVGLTPHELWECSLDDSFPSLRARKLWLAIGHHVWPDDVPASES